MSESSAIAGPFLPSSDIDLWSDEVIAHPYPSYKALRELGPVVWLTRPKAWVVTHHRTIREALLNGEVFTSFRGIAMNEWANRASGGTMLLSEDPDHRRLRKVFGRPLMPAALKDLKEQLARLAETRVTELLAKREFDAVTELAHYLPLTVVTALVGLSEKGKKNMLAWAAKLFDALGPGGYARTDAGIAVAEEAFGYLAGLKREELDPEGWGASLFKAADQGELSMQEAQAMLMDYMGPALDTTINGLSSALYLLGRNPDQWELLRSDPSRVPGAIDETLRMESPIRAFSRAVTRDYELEGVPLREGDRVLMLFACANRDERRYPDPDRFDITRDARDHVAFGYGMHMCAGQHLGKLEIATVLNLLVRGVKRFDILEERRELNNTLRGLAKLVIRVEPT
jgi:cytochrome P450